MEILISKISPNHDDPIFYNGVVAYGKASNGKTYVLKALPEAEIFFDCKKYCGDEIQTISKRHGINDNCLDFFDITIANWFVIYEAQQTEIKEIFEEGDEMGDGLIFQCYDDAIQGFETFLL